MGLLASERFRTTVAVPDLIFECLTALPTADFDATTTFGAVPRLRLAPTLSAMVQYLVRTERVHTHSPSRSLKKTANGQFAAVRSAASASSGRMGFSLRSLLHEQYARNSPRLALGSSGSGRSDWSEGMWPAARRYW